MEIIYKSEPIRRFPLNVYTIDYARALLRNGATPMVSIAYPQNCYK